MIVAEYGVMMIRDHDDSGFGERLQAGFDAAALSSIAFYDFALAAYSYRCAISGVRYARPGGNLHDRLDVVRIHPAELGGPLEIGNVLVLERGIARAFQHGLISVEDDFRVVVLRPEALDGAVLPGRKLFLPNDPLLYPDRKHLQFHRLTVGQ